MEPVVREVLAQQADDLAAGLDAFAAVAKDAGSLLARLDKHLTKLNKLNKPIYDQAARLTHAEQNIIAAKAATDQLLEHLGTARKVEPALRQGPGRDLTNYLALLKQLEGAMAVLEASYTLAVAQEAYEYASNVHRKAMQDCEADFVSGLTQQTNASLPSCGVLMQSAEQGGLQVAVSSPTPPEFAPKALARLKSLADLLIRDPQSTAMTAYAQVRAKALASVLRSAGGPPAAKASVAVQSSEQAEKAAASWSRQLRMLTVASASELALAEAVWGPDFGVQVVGDVLRQPVEALASQGKEMAQGKLQPAKVFVLLDMIRHMDEALPLLEGLLESSAEPEDLIEPLRGLMTTLSAASKELFEAFEGGIVKDASKVQVVDGTVHPLAASTLGYLRRLFTYGDTTQVLFVERWVGGGAMAEMSAQVAAKRMAEVVERCMAGLLQALEGKAKAYKSRSLAAIFLMNNIHYMVATTEQSESLSVLGSAWVERHKDIIDQYGQEYHETVWMPVVRMLQGVESGEDIQPSDISKWKEWVKKHFKAVNKLLEKVISEQTAWNVPDPRLRTAVTRVILQDFLPPYKHLWDAYADTDFSSTRSKYARFSPEEVQRMVTNDLFQGRSVAVVKKQGVMSPERLVPMPTLSEPSTTMSLPSTRARSVLRCASASHPSGLARSVR